MKTTQHAKSAISDYITVKTSKFTPVQAKVPRELVLEVRALLKKTGISWSDLMTACLTKFRDEMKNKH